MMPQPVLRTGGSNFLDKTLDLFSFSLILMYVIIGIKPLPLGLC